MKDLIEFKQESYADCIDDLMPLVELHYDELSRDKDIPLSPRHERYIELDNNNLLRLYTIRQDKKLIGYAAFFVGHNLHYETSYQAVQDVLFIEPKFRGGIGRQFIPWCDEQLKKIGVQKVMHHVKEDICDFSPLLFNLGYVRSDVIYTRRLDQ